MPRAAPLNLDIRSYREDRGADQHEFDQLVLPLNGALDLDIFGCAGRLDTGRAAFVRAGLPHWTMSELPNRSVIVDIDLYAAAPELRERLSERPYITLTPAAGKLIDYMGCLLDEGRADRSLIALWTPLMLDALSCAPTPGVDARLARMQAMIEAEPGQDWTVARMAREASMSVSRLHAVFRERFGVTPRAWLADQRLTRARRWLAASNLSIAEIAFRCGYSDQSALTRAMRDAGELSPGAYRRRAQETAPKLR